MWDGSAANRRRLAITVVVVALLVGILLASGITPPGLGGSSAGPLPPTVRPGSPTATTSLENRVVATVTGRAQRLSDHTWQLTYTVRNTGRTPIAGFQLYGKGVNLFHIRGLPGWVVFGNGVCGQHHQDILIFWSIVTTSPGVIRPGGSGTFSFRANTTGTTPAQYALSWGQAAPLFGQAPIPKSSTFAAGEPCGR